MSQRVAVMIVHGIGTGYPAEARRMGKRLEELVDRRISAAGADRDAALVIEHVDWSDVLNEKQARLRARVSQGGTLAWRRLRSFMVEFLGDAIAYQPTDGRRGVYTQIHSRLADGLTRLAQRAGPDAPLCVVAHSLGTVISSNFLYDLQTQSARDLVPREVKARLGASPIQHGETLAHFFTLGSPLALWGLRYDSPEFGKPIRVPSPELARHHPDARGSWINFYDPDDVIAYPLRELNDEYRAVVTEDRRVNSGPLLLNRTPLSHVGYWLDREVLRPVSEALADLWIRCNARLERVPA